MTERLLEMVGQQLKRPEDLLILPHLAKISETIVLAVRSGLFHAIDAGRDTTAALARALGADPAELSPLLDVLGELGLVQYREGRWRNTPLVETYLTPARGKDLSAVLAHTGDGRFTSPVLLERWGGPAGAKHDCAEADAMQAGNRHCAMRVARRLRARKVTRVLDLGCGPGGFLIEACRACPDLRAWGVDRGEAVVRARRALARTGFENRVTLVEGDLLDGDYPRVDPEAVILANVLHLFGSGTRRNLLHHAVDALSGEGVLYVVDTFAARGDALATLQALEWIVIGSALPGVERFEAELTQLGLKVLRRARISGTPFTLLEAALGVARI